MAKVAQIVRRIDLESQGIIFSNKSPTETVEKNRKILSEQLHELYMRDFQFQGIQQSLLGWKEQEELQVKAVKKLISGDENVDSSASFQEVLNTFMSAALTIVNLHF